VTVRGNVTTSLIAVYKAIGGGWQAGRSRPILDDDTREKMGARNEWKGLLSAPLPPATSDLDEALPPKSTAP
jgi:hypothetical protein